MNEVKICKKKLTESGGGVCTLSFIAMIVSAAGLALEFLGTLGYTSFNDVSQNYMFANDVFSYIFTYDKSIITFVLSLTVFFAACANRRKKKIGGELPAIVILTSVACSASPIAFMVYLFDSGNLADIFSNGSDSEIFRAVMGILVYALPLLACFLLLMCGITIAAKLGGESYTVSVPIVKTVALKADDGFVENIAKHSADALIPHHEIDHDSVVSEETAKPEPTVDIIPDAVPAVAETETVRCHDCGEMVRHNAKFCQKCGAKMM